MEDKDKVITVVKNVRYSEGKGYSFRYNYYKENGKRDSKELWGSVLLMRL